MPTKSTSHWIVAPEPVEGFVFQVPASPLEKAPATTQVEIAIAETLKQEVSFRSLQNGAPLRWSLSCGKGFCLQQGIRWRQQVGFSLAPEQGQVDRG